MTSDNPRLREIYEYGKCVRNFVAERSPNDYSHTSVSEDIYEAQRRSEELEHAP